MINFILFAETTFESWEKTDWFCLLSLVNEVRVWTSTIFANPSIIVLPEDVEIVIKSLTFKRCYEILMYAEQMVAPNVGFNAFIFQS